MYIVQSVLWLHILECCGSKQILTRNDFKLAMSGCVLYCLLRASRTLAFIDNAWIDKWTNSIQANGWSKGTDSQTETGRLTGSRVKLKWYEEFIQILCSEKFS